MANDEPVLLGNQQRYWETKVREYLFQQDHPSLTIDMTFTIQAILAESGGEGIKKSIIQNEMEEAKKEAPFDLTSTEQKLLELFDEALQQPTINIAKKPPFGLDR